MNATVRKRLFLVLLAVATLPAIGCLAAGLAAAGAAACAGAGGYAYVKGRMTRDYPASIADTTQAAQTSLTELGFPVLDKTSAVGSATLVTETSNGHRLSVDLTTIGSDIPSDAGVTRVGIRVGVFGDEHVSDRILDQIALHLVPGARPRQGVFPPGQGPLQPIAATGGQEKLQPIPVTVMENPGVVPALHQRAPANWTGKQP